MALVIRNREEFVVLPRWLRYIIGRHCSTSLENPHEAPIEIGLRQKIGGIEIDMVVICRSGRRHIRIGFELKTDDFYKASEQSIKRRDYFHYFYIVLNHSVGIISSCLRNVCKQIFPLGIGVVSGIDDCVVVYSYPKHHLDEARRYTTLFDYIKPKGERCDNRGEG